MAPLGVLAVACQPAPGAGFQPAQVGVCRLVLVEGYRPGQEVDCRQDPEADCRQDPVEVCRLVLAVAYLPDQRHAI